MEDKPYLKYADKFKKINLLSIIMQCVTIVMILAFLFIPMFVYEREITEADFGGDLEKFLQYLETLSAEELLSGKAPTIKENFSIFDELMKNLSAFSSNGEYSSMIGMLLMLFPLFTVIMGVILLVMAGKQLYERITANNDFESFCMLEYSSIKKSGEGREKKSFWKRQNIFAFTMYYVMSFIFGKVETKMYGSIIDVSSFTYWVGASVSGWIVLGVLLLVASVVLSVMIKQKKTEVTVEITKEDFLKKEEEKSL